MILCRLQRIICLLPVQVRAPCRRVQPKVQRHMFSHGLLHITTKTVIRNLNIQTNGHTSFRYNKVRRFESCPRWDSRSRELCSSNTTLPLLRTTTTTTKYLLLPNLSFSPRFQLRARPARQTMVPKRSTGVEIPAARRSPLIGSATTSCKKSLQPLHLCLSSWLRPHFVQPGHFALSSMSKPSHARATDNYSYERA
ncbi:hypothetical protein V8C44DRAFT_75145 [Trichoderma aethiopicum]